MPHIKKGQTLVSGSHGSSVSIVTALRVGQSGVRFSAKKKKIFVQYPKRPNQVSDPPRLLFIGYRSVSPGVKRQGRESDHSPLSSAEFKNKWSSTSVPPPLYTFMPRAWSSLPLIFAYLLTTPDAMRFVRFDFHPRLWNLPDFYVADHD